MVKRSKRNIGKRVRVSHPDSWLYGRLGTIKGFRGDIRKGNPVVSVYIDDLHAIDPIPGSNLEYVK